MFEDNGGPGGGGDDGGGGGGDNGGGGEAPAGPPPPEEGPPTFGPIEGYNPPEEEQPAPPEQAPAPPEEGAPPPEEAPPEQPPPGYGGVYGPPGPDNPYPTEPLPGGGIGVWVPNPDDPDGPPILLQLPNYIPPEPGQPPPPEQPPEDFPPELFPPDEEGPGNITIIKPLPWELPEPDNPSIITLPIPGLPGITFPGGITGITIPAPIPGLPPIHFPGGGRGRGPGRGPGPAPRAPITIVPPIPAPIRTQLPPIQIQRPTQVQVQPEPFPTPGFAPAIPIIVNVIPAPAPATTGSQQLPLIPQPLEVSLPGLERIVSDLQQQLADHGQAVLEVANRIEGDLSVLVEQLLPTEVDQLTQANRLQSAAINAFTQAFPDQASIASGFATVIADNGEAIGQWLTDLLTLAAPDLLNNLLTTINQERGDPLNNFLGGLLNSACVSAAVKGLLAPIAGAVAAGDGLAAIFGIVHALDVFLDAALSGPAALVHQDSFECARPELLTISEVNEARRRSLIEEGYGRQQLAKRGLSDQNIETVRGLAKRLIEHDDLLDLWLRDFIPTEDRDQRLQALGFTPEDAQLLVELRQLLPTPTDLVRWMLRDLFPAPFATATLDDQGNATFTESTEKVNFVESFGMDLEFPEDVLKLSQQLGIPDQFMHRYWQAHWELPSPEQGFQMFQRGFIPDQALERLLRARGIEPYWRPAYLKIAFRPITRVDIRRLHKVGLLDHEQLVRRYRDIGYNPDDAELLARFTERLNADTDKAVKLNEVQFVAGHIKTAYLNGSLTQGAAVTHLLELGFTQDHVNAFVTEADFLRQLHVHDQVRDAVKKLYVTGHWTKEEVTAELRRRDFDPWEILQLFQSWDLDRDLRELTDEEKHHRELARAEIIEAFIDRIVDQPTALAHLRSAGYSEADAAVLLHVAEFRQQKQEQREAIDAVKAQYLTGALSRAGASARLDALHLTSTRRNNLLDSWSLESVKKGTRLSVQQLDQLVKAELITAPEVRDELHREGYRQLDIDRIILLLGLTDAEAAARVAASQQEAVGTAQLQAAATGSGNGATLPRRGRIRHGTQ